MMRAFSTSGLYIGAVALLAASLALSGHSQQRGARSGPPPASVFVEPVREEAFATRVEAIGTLEPNERAELTLSASDRVTAVYFEDGQRVTQGKTLISLAQREQAALVEAAEADLAQARQELARLEPLASQGAVSQTELDVARRNANSAAAQLRALQSRQSDRVLVAPFDGVLGFRRVSVGSFVRPGDVVATLIDDSVMRLEFAVPSGFVRALQPGLAIEATTRDLPGRAFEGTVASIDNLIDPVTRSVRVRAMIPNADGELRAGMFVSVTLLAEPRQALSIPESALQPIGPQTFVWIADQSIEPPVARRVRVEPGQRQAGRVEIVAGLTRDQLVITDGVMRVREGAPLTIREPSMLLPGVSSSAVGGPGTPALN